MKKINVNVLLIMLIVIILITLGIFEIVRQNKKEDLINIEGVNFTLNDVKKVFLNSYNKKCSIDLTKDRFIIKCNNKKYEYKYNGMELEIETNSDGLEIFKYLVNSIEYLHGYKDNEYLDTMNRFINNEISIEGIDYQTKKDTIYLKVVVNKKLEKYDIKDVINKEEIKLINDTKYEYKKDKYIITGIKINKDDEEKKYIFSGTYSGPDFNKDFIIKYYDSNKNKITEKKVKLSEYNNYGNTYINFVVTTSIDLYDKVTYYSINLQ